MKLGTMIAPVSWSSSGSGVIAIEGTFDGKAAHQLGFFLAHTAHRCLVDFSGAREIRPHALGSLLLHLEEMRPRIEIKVRGWNRFHRSIAKSFGYVLDEQDRLRHL
jgi:hypothetical protein